MDGTAAVQVVPLGDFQGGHNEQVYDDDPQIVSLFVQEMVTFGLRGIGRGTTTAMIITGCLERGCLRPSRDSFGLRLTGVG